MWDTVMHTPGAWSRGEHLSHDRPCPHCGHAGHTYLACGDQCDCQPALTPGQLVA